MNQVIFNADDFGYSKAINYGIVDAHQFGFLTSTTLLANMSGFDHAVTLSKAHPKLGIGIHLTLTCGQSILKNHQTITNSKGEFHPLDFYKETFNVDLIEVENEWEAQIQKILNAKIKPSHLDSHHHIHTLGPLKDIIVKLARKYNLAVRHNCPLPKDIRKVARFETEFDQVRLQNEHAIQMYLNNLVVDIHKYGTVEVMCHPGYIDESVYTNSSLHQTRFYVVDFMIHSQFKERLENDENIQLVNYHTLRIK